LMDKFSFSPGHSHPIERKMPISGIVWGVNRDPGILSLLVHSLDFEYDFFSMLHHVFLSMEYSHVHVCVLNHSSIYLFPRARFCPMMISSDFWKDQFSRESYYRPLYYSYKGKWRRTYFKRMFNMKKICASIKVLLFAKGIVGDLYTFCDMPTLIVYVPPVEDVHTYLNQVVSHFVRLSGRISSVNGRFVPPTSMLTSYDVCHSTDPRGGMCNSIHNHKRFCNLVGVPVTSPAFSCAYELFRSSDAVCPGSIENKCMDGSYGYIDQVAKGGDSPPVWKYFCGVCAFPHSKFGMHLKNGEFLCGENEEYKEKCTLRPLHIINGPGCAARYARDRARRIHKYQYKVSSYSGVYSEVDSIWKGSEEYFQPSFGSQLVFYNSLELFSATIMKCRKTRMCTCMVADVVCDSTECRRRLMMNDSDFYISCNVLKTHDGDTVFPDDPRKFIRPYVPVEVPFMMRDWIRKMILYERSGGDFSDYSWAAPFKGGCRMIPDNG